MIQTIVPNNKEHWLEMRRKVLTSTEMAALFGVSPYVTPFELFHRKKKGFDVAFEPNERVKWGSRLERSVAEGVAEDNNWKIRKMDEFIFDDELRIGASFDYSIESDPLGILEIKCVDALRFRDDWLVDGESIEATPQIEVQIQTQLLVSGRSYVQLAGLIGGNKIVEIRREPDAKVFDAIRMKAKEFWDSVDRDEAPAPNFEMDADFIGKLYNYAEPGKVMKSMAGDHLHTLMAGYKTFSDQEKEAKERKEAIKAEMLTAMGDAEKVVGDGWSISAGLIGPAHIEYERAPYRAFKPYFKKQKGE